MSMDGLPTYRGVREELEQLEESEGEADAHCMQGSSWNRKRARGGGPLRELESVLKY